MRTREDILDMIGHMLAVTVENGATENEAAVAAERVQALLQQHNFSLAQVEAAAGKKDEDVAREKQFSGMERRAMYDWQCDLMRTLAECNFCIWQKKKVRGPERTRKNRWGETETFRRWVNQHLVVGRALNVTVTLQTYDYLTGTIGALVKEEGYTGTDAVAFYEGAVNRLSMRLHERRRAAEQESRRAAEQHAMNGNGSGTELVLSDVYGTEADQNNDFLNSYPRGTTAERRRASEAKQAAQQARHDELVAAGMDTTKAWYVAYGYGEAAAESMARSWRRGNGGRSRAGTGWSSGNARRYTGAYRKGAEAGASIGLDTQVGGGSGHKRIK